MSKPKRRSLNHQGEKAAYSTGTTANSSRRQSTPKAARKTTPEVEFQIQSNHTSRMRARLKKFQTSKTQHHQHTFTKRSISGYDNNSLMARMLFAFYSNSTTVGLQKSNDIKILKLLKENPILHAGMLSALPQCLTGISII